MITYTSMNGEWCLKSTVPLAQGAVVTVTKRDGTTRQERVGALVSAVFSYIYAIDRSTPIETEPVSSNSPGTFGSSPPSTTRPTQVEIGGMAGIDTLFRSAQQHLRRAAIVLSVPALNTSVRIFPANDYRFGRRAIGGGGYAIVAAERPSYGRRRFYGRVTERGTYERMNAFLNEETVAAITDRLRAFAADPAAVAAEHGRLTGRCCFCNLGLTDERSTSVGYGPICAGHYGLPWGDRPAPTHYAGAPRVGRLRRREAQNRVEPTVDYLVRRDLDALRIPRERLDPAAPLPTGEALEALIKANAEREEEDERRQR